MRAGGHTHSAGLCPHVLTAKAIYPPPSLALSLLMAGAIIYHSGRLGGGEKKDRKLFCRCNRKYNIKYSCSFLRSFNEMRRRCISPWKAVCNLLFWLIISRLVLRGQLRRQNKARMSDRQWHMTGSMTNCIWMRSPEKWPCLHLQVVRITEWLN